MKAEELRGLDSEELGGRLRGARRELYELRFKLAVGQQDNHREIRKARKEIARILTVVHQRRLEAVEGPLEEPDTTAGTDAEEAATAQTGVEGEAIPAAVDAEEPEEGAVAAEPDGGQATPDQEPGSRAGRSSAPRRGRKASSEDEEA